MTLRENIAIFDVDRIDETESIKSAAHKAEVDAIYKSLPEGLDADLTKSFKQ